VTEPGTDDERRVVNGPVVEPEGTGLLVGGQLFAGVVVASVRCGKQESA
jgi:hypothetical protein